MWRNGFQNGVGEQIYENNESYQGEFKDGLPEGHGTYKGSNNISYVGSW